MQITTPAMVALALLLAAPAAQAASAREVFEKYGLTGTYAPDCSQPVSPQNPYVVHRVLDAERVQYDWMVEATKSSATVIVSASESGPNEITFRAVSGVRHIDAVYRVEGRRHRMMHSTRDDGIKVVVDGRAAKEGSAMPWMNRCG